jgi:serine protease Do
MGIGFAIPSNLAKSIAEQLIDNGQVTRGYLGIVIQQLTADLARSFDVEPSQGILVAQVNSESPADQAGLKEGDIIVAYDGQSVSDVGNFRNRVSLTPPGSRKQLTVVRDGKELDIAVTIGRLGDIAVTAEDKTNRSEAVGLTVQTLTPELAEHLGAKFGEGVVVRNVQAGSIAARAGIRPGAVILQVDRSPVNTVSDFERAIESARTNEQVLLLIRMDGAQRYVSLSW